ncbi:MAG: aspartate carbamoyltransferase regulatory subunit [Candidatus Magasanikbacteria bacterium RIFOXYC2_FULL_42_28]|uniref:Aspartate carbamoyltransferase regulatory chain n=1 Tax=Candidatus Magasanikbacteria bacterium RIFOXYC2_FULL_42_28 TaxID=1798704 RepID=A0A1F6NUQ6_9BACT|nr:MAG: aspartate carbamoyltransferase regulatory subunit [Candidatus Magasanikbacteria bacterium RIFOXYC2_FULL_42_28]
MIQQTGTLLVSAIKNGTVIDHAKAGSALKILSILGVENHDNVVTIGMHLPSKTSGKKDIIKLANWEITPSKANLTAIFSPSAVINIIKDFKVVKKYQVELSEIISGLVVCPNPKCITNNESMDSLFHTQKNKQGVSLKCHYCERTFKQEDIKEYHRA